MHTLRLVGDIAFPRLLLEVQHVREAGAAAAFDRHAQRQLRVALLLRQELHLFGGRRRKLYDRRCGIYDGHSGEISLSCGRDGRRGIKVMSCSSGRVISASEMFSKAVST